MDLLSQQAAQAWKQFETTGTVADYIQYIDLKNQLLKQSGDFSYVDQNTGNRHQAEKYW